MNRDIATHAQQDATAIHEGLLHRDQSALGTLMDEINQEKQKLTPAQYREYMADLNKDLKMPLGGLEITGITGRGENASLNLKDAAGTYSVSRHDQQTLYHMAGSRIQLKDGTQVIVEGQTVNYIRHNRDGSSDYTVDQAPSMAQNYHKHVTPDGSSVTTFATGRVVVEYQKADKTRVTDSISPWPGETYHKEAKPETYKNADGSWKIN